MAARLACTAVPHAPDVSVQTTAYETSAALVELR